MLFPNKLFDKIENGLIKKGDPLKVAQIAELWLLKKQQISFQCVIQSFCRVVILHFNYQRRDNGYDLIIQATINCSGKTGVEMEALTAVSIAALTFYDMCKAVDKTMIIKETFLVQKTGGKSGDFFHEL